MKIKLICIGKPKFSFIKEGVNHFSKVINQLIEFDLVQLPDVRISKKNYEILKRKEAVLLKKEFKKCSQIYLFDEQGKEYTSYEFASFIDRQILNSVKTLCFVIAGAYGFDVAIKKEYAQIALSKMTFPHDLVRIIAMEQIYRALSIIKGKKYHH